MRLKQTLVIFITILINEYSYSQSISLVNSQTASTLANTLAGIGINIPGTNQTLTCNSLANGLFANVNPFPTQSLAIDSGMVLCTGRVLSTTTDTGINATRFRLASNNFGTTASDAQIASIAGSTAVQKDLCYLEFDFIPRGDSAFIDYVFASEDYPEYACSLFIDAFGIFVSPPSSSTYTNYAKVPGTSINVSINSINDTSKQTGASNYTTYCTSLGAGAPFIQYYTANTLPNHIVYDGMTKVLKARFAVSPNLTHRMKIAIADILDGNFDSGIFLKKNSFISPPLLEITEKKSTGGSTATPLYLIEGCSAGSVKFNRSSTATALTVNVSFLGTASSADHNAPTSFVIPAGNSTYTYSFSALADALVEGQETLRLVFSCAALSYNDTVDYVIKDFANGIQVFNATNDTTICNGRTVNLSFTRPDTFFSGIWTPATNLSCTNCQTTTYTANNGNTFSTQIVNLRISATGCTSIDTPITINIQPKPNITVPSTYSLCVGDSIRMVASASPTGGTYNYVWSPPTFLSATNVANPFTKPTANQVYKLVVSSAIGCKDSTNISVNVSNIRAEIDSMRSKNTTCGASNGSISLYTRTTSPSFPPYQYSINGGSSYTSSNVFNGLSAGTYNVSIKNAANCRFDTTLTVSSGASAPSATISKINTKCGLSNGVATVVSKTGKAPLTLTWKLGATTISTDTFISGKASGVYTLMITDSAGCSTQYSVNILTSNAVAVNIAKSDPSCGINNGSIVVSPTAGVAPFSYIWSTGATTNSISGLSAGVYKVTTTDDSGCTRLDSIQLVSFPSIVSTKTFTNANCGSNSGTAQAIVSSGGTAPFVYSWSNGVVSASTTNTTHMIMGLAAGKYKFTITDSKGCTSIDSVMLTSNPAVTFSLTKTNSTCGNPNGVINITSLSGTAPYTFLWSDGATTQNRTSLNSGNYSVTVTDLNGCTASSSTTISTNSNPSLTTTKNDASCGKNNGSMFSILSGAKPPVTYLWSNGKTSSFIDSLAPGIYSITITDSFGCQRVKSDTIKQPSYTNFSSSVIQPICGLGNASITLSSITGASPITILWSDGNTSATRTSLSAGTYSVFVQDGNSCTKTQTFTITSSSKPKISFAITHALCNATSGSIASTISGGTANYTYSWSSGETTPNITSKPTGVYMLAITDANGCKDTLLDSIRRFPSPTYRDTFAKATCGIDNGWIKIRNTKGSGPFTYTWGPSVPQVDTAIYFLKSIQYFLTITDVNGCSVKDTFDLFTKGPVTFTKAITKPTCKDSNAKITLSMTGGTAPYTITWSNRDTGLVADSLKHGKYGVRIVDSLGCLAFDSIKINDSTQLRDSVNIVYSRCDSVNGKITIIPIGGTAPFKYIWNRLPRDTFATIDSLNIGFYDVRVIDSNGCKYDTTVEMKFNHQIFLRDSSTMERCDSMNAKAFIWVDSAISPIKIFWDNVLDSVYVKQNLGSPRFVSVRVVDSQKCEVSRQIEIFEVPINPPTLTKQLPPCGNNLGKILVTANNVKKYLWNTGDTTSLVDSLSPGVYTVTVTDTTGCTYIRKDSLYYSTPPTISHQLVRPNCGRFDGKVKIYVNSLYGAFSHEWGVLPSSTPDPNPYTDSVIKDNITAGNYLVKIIDAIGCERRDTIRLIDSAGPQLAFTITNSNCVNGFGKIKVNSTVGSPPFNYLWYNFSSKDSVTGLVGGTYRVTATDARGCVKEDSATVLFRAKPEINLLGTDSKCGLNNGQIITVVSFGLAPYTYNWSNGATTKNLSGLAAGKYVLTITDSLGCMNVDSVTISSQPLLNVSITSRDASCGLANGTATAIVISGKPPYTQSWDGIYPTLAVSGLDSGMHIFTITDSNQCSKKDTIYLKRYTKPVISYNSANDNCTYNTGYINASATGGKPPLSYQWSGGLGTSPNITGLGAGNYTLNITDSMNCTSSLSINISDTAGPVVSLVLTNATCGLNNGMIQANVTSTRNPLSYFWNNVSGTTSKTGINGGKYVFKAIDSRGCIKQDSVLMDTVKPITVVKNVKQASCNLNNAYIKLKSSGGTGSHIYTWSHTSSNVDSIYALTPGWYKFTVSDVSGCQVIDSVNIIQTGNPAINFSKTPATCRTSNGGISATITGGNVGYSFVWSNGNTSSTLSNVPMGYYSVTVSDGAGCTVNAGTTLVSIGVDSIDLSILQPRCEVNNGKVKAIPINTIGNKIYAWSTGSNIDSINMLSPGVYSVTISDSLCTATKSANLVMAKSPVIATNERDASCNINNGRILTTINFGTAPFNYSWSNSSSAPSLLNIDSGTYVLTVTDVNNCMDTVSVHLIRIPMLTANFTIQKSTCGNSNASVQTAVSGGKANYTYAWNSGQNMPNLNNIVAGNYVLTLSDNGNCTIVENVIVEDKKKPRIVSQVINAICGKSNGSIDNTILDGTPPFLYTWNTGATSQDLSGLSPGIFKLTVTDSIGCVDSSTILVDPGLPPPRDTASVVNSTCGLANGSIMLVYGRAVSPVYTWSTGFVGNTISSIPAGKYFVTVTDARQCVMIDSFVVQTTENPVVTATTTNSYCQGANGTISTLVSKGTAPFTYTWNTGATTPSLTNSLKGTYYLTVTDLYGCVDTAIVRVFEDPNKLTASIQRSHLKCYQDASGKLTITPVNGSYPYIYTVNSPIPDSIVYGLSAGFQTYEVEDSRGCKFRDTFTLFEPNRLATRLINKTNLKCYEIPTGVIEVGSVGGTAPYTYTWSPSGKTGYKVTDLSSGLHFVSVTDMNGCTDTLSASLTQPTDIVVFPTISKNLCNGQSKASVQLSVSQGTPPYTYSWDTREKTSIITGLKEGNYKVTVADANGCVDTSTHTVKDPAKLESGKAEGSTLRCKGIIDGEIVVEGQGGTPPYLYSIDTGRTFQFQNKFQNLFAGSYYLTIKDKNECQTFVTTKVNDYIPFTIKAYPNDTTIALDETISLGYDVLNGSKAWVNSILWSDGDGLSCTDCENPAVNIYTPHTYVLEVKYLEKCVVYDTIFVNILDTTGLYIPNAFSPNAKESENQTFKIYSNHLISAKLIIFNRVGEKMFETNDGHQKGWNGMYNGEPAQAGVYSYVVHAIYLGGRRVERKGSVTLVR